MPLHGYPTEEQGGNMYGAFEWSSSGVGASDFSTVAPLAQIGISEPDHECCLDAHLGDTFNEVMVDRMSNLVGVEEEISDRMLLDDDIGSRLGAEFCLMSEDRDTEISIDPELLTLRPRCLDNCGWIRCDKLSFVKTYNFSVLFERIILTLSFLG